MMKRYSAWIVGAMMMAICIPAMAQPQRGGRGGFGAGGPGGPGGGFGFGGGGGASTLQLVGNRAVQEELALSEDQVAKLGTLREEFQQKQRASLGDLQGLRDLSEEEQRARRTEIGEAARKLNAEYEPKVAAILDDVQVERLQQIKWQIAGVGALRDEELAKKLALTQDQKDKIDVAFSEFQAKQRELFGAGRGAGGEGAARDGFARMRELGEARDKQVTDVLTASQKTQFEELKGEPFDVQAALRGGRGGEGARPGQRGQRPEGGEGARPGRRPEGGEGRGRQRGDGEGRPQRPDV